MHSAPDIAGTPRPTPAFQVPDNACDCHVHIIGDRSQFPLAEDRIYTPPPASLDDLLGLQRALGLSRAVIVQPSVYGCDNSCTIDAVRRLGSRARGVAVIDRTAARPALEAMNRAGIRGVRLNLETHHPEGFDPERAKQLLEATAAQIDGLNWHVQLYARIGVVASLARHIAQLAIPLVLDHFAGANPAHGPRQKCFEALLDLIAAASVYVKLSGPYRISDGAPDYVDMAPLAEALVQANPERILWGTDWPHTNSAYGRGRSLNEMAPPLPIDDAALMNALATWVREPAIRKKVLVDNPARLYGFEP